MANTHDLLTLPTDCMCGGVCHHCWCCTRMMFAGATGCCWCSCFGHDQQHTSSEGSGAGRLHQGTGL